MNFWFLIIFLGAAFLLQFVFTLIQIKMFSKKYNELRKLGRVAIGVVKGGFRAGAIVMFSIDEYGDILKCSYITGVTILARFKYFDDLNGSNINCIDSRLLNKMSKQLRRAVTKAVDTYNSELNNKDELFNGSFV